MAQVAIGSGGDEYEYALPGSGVTDIYVPPAGFDPATASSATLTSYGLPQAPVGDGLQALAAWQAAMAAARFPAPAPTFLAESSTTAAPESTNTSAQSTPADVEDSGNWSGFLARGQFTLSWADYFEPTYGSSAPCTKVGAFIWPGLGGFNGNNDLGQDGTAFGSTGISNHQAWEEVLPQQQGVVPLNFTVNPGDYIYAEAEWGSGKYDGIVEDETTGVYQSWSHAGNYPSSGETGEAIVEDPGGDGLANFRAVVWQNVYEDGYSMNHYSPNGVRTGLYMYNGGDELAYSGDVGSNGDFNDNWKQCR